MQVSIQGSGALRPPQLLAIHRLICRCFILKCERSICWDVSNSKRECYLVFVEKNEETSNPFWRILVVRNQSGAMPKASRSKTQTLISNENEPYIILLEKSDCSGWIAHDWNRQRGRPCFAWHTEPRSFEPRFTESRRRFRNSYSGGVPGRFQSDG